MPSARTRGPVDNNYINPEPKKAHCIVCTRPIQEEVLDFFHAAFPTTHIYRWLRLANRPARFHSQEESAETIRDPSAKNKIMISNAVNSGARVHLFTSQFLSAHRCNASNKGLPRSPMKQSEAEGYKSFRLVSVISTQLGT